MLENEQTQIKIGQLADLLFHAPSIACLTGAGISTESGIPDFRSANGFYRMTSEEIFSIDFFRENPAAFYQAMAPVYQTIFSAIPNAGHRAIADLEHLCGKKVTVVTQNIDGLHTRAGSGNVHEIHGTLETFSCQICGRQYQGTGFRTTCESGQVPHCDCGGVLKPDITFYGEQLPVLPYHAALQTMWETRLLLILGTSMQVYPAAGLPRECDSGTPFVIINKIATVIDFQCKLVFHDNIGDILPAAVQKLRERLE